MSVPMPENLGGVAHLLSNIGVEDTARTRTTAYLYSNIGVMQPSPYVLGAKQSEVYVNQSVDVVVTGVGTDQDNYITKVEVQNGLGEWNEVSVVAWTNVAATANNATDGRTIAKDMSVIDPEHKVLRITAPEWASPPHLPIRVTVRRGADDTDGFHDGSMYLYTNVT